MVQESRFRNSIKTRPGVLMVITRSKISVGPRDLIIVTKDTYYRQ